METPVTFSLHSTIPSSLLSTRVFSFRNLINSHFLQNPICSFFLSPTHTSLSAFFVIAASLRINDTQLGKE
ncbi:hypothetical protein Lser_V15G35724 [Lactuca serriola]